jgi:haloalkane dehalogenase
VAVAVQRLGAIVQSPEQFGWLFDWQKMKFRDALPKSQRVRFNTVIGPLISDNFIQQPSSGPAFVQLASADGLNAGRESSL